MRACRNGDASVVHALLHLPGIDVNVQNKVREHDYIYRTIPSVMYVYDLVFLLHTEWGDGSDECLR